MAEGTAPEPRYGVGVKLLQLRDSCKPVGLAQSMEAEAPAPKKPWDGVSERRKLDAPVDRRVSPESVAQAAFKLAQQAGQGGADV